MDTKREINHPEIPGVLGNDHIAISMFIKTDGNLEESFTKMSKDILEAIKSKIDTKPGVLGICTEGPTTEAEAIAALETGKGYIGLWVFGKTGKATDDLFPSGLTKDNNGEHPVA